MADQESFKKYMKFYTDHKEEVFKELGIGSVAGYCAGAFSRKATRAGIIIAGGAFVGIQLLSQSGYVNVEWNKLEKEAISFLDQNGDNVVDSKDLKILYDRYIQTLQFRIPGSSGFAVAFLLGWRGKLI